VLAFACSLQSDTPLAPKPAAGPTRVTDKTVFHEFQVEKPAKPAPGNKAPRYPDLLRSSGIEGEVLAQFVLDTTGFADMSSFKVLKSTHDLFTAAVRGSLPTFRFEPAEVGGRKVKQLVQMPFQFSLSKGAPPQTEPVVITGVRLPASTSVKAPEPLKFAPARTMAAGEGVPNADVAASPRPGNPAPRYPDQLRAQGVEGEVLARVAVNTDGTPDMSTFGIVRSTNDQFSVEVRNAVKRMRFIPAIKNGQPVKQLIQMPFQFSLTP